MRTVVGTVVVLAAGSAASGFLLHRDAPTRPVGAPSAIATTAGPTPTDSARPWSAPTGSGPAGPTAAKPNSVTTSASPASPVVAKGAGHYRLVHVPLTSRARSGRAVTYTLQIETGMHADDAAVARSFGAALLDRRGWQGTDKVRFVQLDAAAVKAGRKARVRVIVASPARVNSLCAPLPTDGGTSCDTPDHVVLNYKLWTRGVKYYAGQLAQYREYMVGHEVGHALGHGHQFCAKKGAYAPVMQQQTLGLHGCRPWPWPKRPDAHGRA